MTPKQRNPRAKAKREAPKVEAWGLALVAPNGYRGLFFPGEEAKLREHAEPGTKFVRLVPADPLADAVVRTLLEARAAYRAWAADVNSATRWKAYVKGFV